MSDKNLVDNQTWQTIQTLNYQIQKEEQEQKLENQRLARGQVSSKQQVEKDVLLPAALTGECATSLKGKKAETNDSPKLPAPSGGLPYMGDDEKSSFGKDEGLIAIIGAVLALQAKCNSNFWSTLWKQTSASMMQQVKFAPLIAEATIAAANEQAKATEAQATQDEIDGWINIGMFGLSVGAGILMEYKQPELDDVKSNVTTEVESAERAGTRVTNQVSQKIQQGENFAKSVASGGKNLTNAAKIQSRLTGFLLKLGGVAQSFGMAAQGSTLLVNAKYESIQANHQQAQGVQEALSKEEEQYAQFYGQDFSRGTDLAQGSAQNIDYAMSILKSASDTITQTVNSMFRG